ncbi:hypothetical protein ACL1FZ_08045 [Corynebacterium striatum]|nr:hypothetical protein [Corynebacterium striatum]HBC7266737.1 hypothetical protein [Corynebacterium striatum]
MKRLPQTLTAAVLTGALAFGGAAVAQAQTEATTTATTPAEEVTGEIERHDVAADPITVDGVEYFKQENGTWLSKPVAGDPVRLTPEQAEKFVKDLTPEQAEKFVKEQQDTSAIPAPATKMDAEGNTWYQSMKDPSVYVNDPALVNVEVTPEMRDAYAKAFPSETPSDPQKPGFDAKKLAWLALPAALIIGGITWYLSQDGKTYVKDEARKNQQPTAEEKAASEQMLNANKNEVIAQGGKLAEGAAPAAARGMSAETGSNSVAQALAALAVAAMVAAGAFAARRKFFA